MDKWDNKDKSKDDFMAKIMEVLPKYLENLDKPKKHRVTLYLDNKELKKVSEALQ